MKTIKPVFFVLVFFTTTNCFSQTLNTTNLQKKAIESAKAYLESYNTPELKEKKAMLTKCFDEQGYVYTPTRKLDKSGVWEMISGFHEDYKMELISKIKVHHNFLTFRWKYSELKGNGSWTGIDFCEFGPDGRLTKVIIYFDE